MSTSQRAAQLRTQAEALDSMAALEQALLDAKAAYAEDPTPQTRAAKQDAAWALREARELSRLDRAGSVGGDAFVVNGMEG